MRAFYTFQEMVESMSHNAPHALVQQEWSRLESAVRHSCRTWDANPRDIISKLIDTVLCKHPVATSELIEELHIMRKLRNRCAHGEAPPLSVEEAGRFAYRAWHITSAIACGDATLLSQSSRWH
jgi:hypothetical protein